MYKLIIKTAEDGILLLTGVGDDEKSLREHGESWINSSGVLSNAVTINVINLVDHNGQPQNGQQHNGQDINGLQHNGERQSRKPHNGQQQTRQGHNGQQFPEQNGEQNQSENGENNEFKHKNPSP